MQRKMEKFSKNLLVIVVLENGSDVWRGVWRCTHAKLVSLTPHSLARDRHYGPASGQRNWKMGYQVSQVRPHILIPAHNNRHYRATIVGMTTFSYRPHWLK